MKYVDLHCDTLTVCADKGLDIRSCSLQADLEKLKKSECAAQCFAVFTDGGLAALNFEKYINYYLGILPKISHIAAPIKKFSDFAVCEKQNKTGIILTVENLGFIGGVINKIDRLASLGVKMASLVWNNKNVLASPNSVFCDGVLPYKRNGEGLSALGAEAVERLDANRIIIDISHLSDGGADEILTGRKNPVAASHSNAQAVRDVSRNLTDGQIKKIAACGGVIGVNFCANFLGNGTFDDLYRHISHIINKGGEEVVALGSDFDGIPENAYIKDCTAVPRMFEYLSVMGISPRVLEKLAFKNFYRVFKEVCG